MWMPCHLTVTKEEYGCAIPEGAVSQERLRNSPLWGFVELVMPQVTMKAKRELCECSAGKTQDDLSGVDGDSSPGHTMRCGERRAQGGLGYQTEVRWSHPR